MCVSEKCVICVRYVSSYEKEEGLDQNLIPKNKELQRFVACSIDMRMAQQWVKAVT
jgi:hypothetical protein